MRTVASSTNSVHVESASHSAANERAARDRSLSPSLSSLVSAHHKSRTPLHLVSPPSPSCVFVCEAREEIEAMATAMACTQLAAAAAAPCVAQKSRFFGSVSSVSMVACSNGSRVSMGSEWMPGQPRPSYLDGSAPGDFGFDPLGFGEVPENLERYKESELIHCRWAMVAVPGVLIPEILGLGNWVSAQKWAAVPNGQATYLGQPVPWGTLPVILAVEALALAFVEAQRNLEADPEKRKYPGGPFDPLSFSANPTKFAEYKVKELKNGRLALLAFVGFVVQAIAYPGTGPVENLLSHLSNPWTNNIANIVIPRSIL